MASTTSMVRSTCLKILTSTLPTAINLPANTSNPEEVSVPDRACQIVIFFHAATHVSWGSTAAGADTDMDAGSYLSFEDGDQISLDCSGMDKNFYFRAAGGSIATAGVRYFFYKED